MRMSYIRRLKVDYMQIKSSDDLAINGKAGTLKPALVESGKEIFIIWNGATSWSDNTYPFNWNYVKLAGGDDEN